MSSDFAGGKAEPKAKKESEVQQPVSVIGRVGRLYRYPVKSMHGEELETAYIVFSGVHGDRIFAFRNSAGPENFPYLTARSQKTMLRYRPRFRDTADTGRPGDSGNSTVDVQTPDGQVLAIDDPELILSLGRGLFGSPTLTLLRSDHAMTDCHPISLVSLQTAQTVGEKIGISLDPRRFRANIYLDLGIAEGFGEDALVGKTVRVGSQVVLSILERDRRCRMISLDPETAESDPRVLQSVVRDHEGRAGVYAAVLVEGAIHPGDRVEILD